MADDVSELDERASADIIMPLKAVHLPELYTNGLPVEVESGH
jgi:hypothetical protein